MESIPLEKRGTVTALSSIFPTEEVQKASKHLQDTILERKQQLDQIKSFINDNVNLINLVKKLPDEINHSIMVPFGKAAFFPGQLIHTNEFMILLGEGYYAERTSKQTTEILKRRGKSLDIQVESLKAIMQDLKAEASFFNATAQESAEGLVDIKEEYDEEGLATPGYKKPDFTILEVDGAKAVVEDEEYMRIFSRIAELEKQEEEAEKKNEPDEDEQIQTKPDTDISQISGDQVRNSQVEASVAPQVSKDGSSVENSPSVDSSLMSKALDVPEVKKKIEAPRTNSDTAFTGSIVEHTHNMGSYSTEQQSGARSSKPVSRFKMQRK